MRPLLCGCLVALLLLLFPRPSPAAWSTEGERGWADLGGSFRTVAVALRNYDEPELFGEGNGHDVLSQSILRLTLEGERDSLGFEVHLVQDFLRSSLPGGLSTAGSAGVASSSGRYRVAGASWKWVESGDSAGRLYFDRFNIGISLPVLDVTLGRQAVNFSQAYFWNPLDVFLPFDPESFDRDYKPGVDALKVDIALGSFSSLTLVAAPGRELEISEEEGEPVVRAVDFTDEPWYGSALLARARTNVRDWDLAFQGGKVYGGWQLGGGFSGGAGDLGLRGEAVWFTPVAGREEDLLEEYVALVAGLDHRFEGGLHVGVEYLYHGAGGDYVKGITRASVGETLSLGRHLAGADLLYEFHPLLSGHLSWIYSFSDSSSLLSPVFSLSLSDESALDFGAILGFGERPSRDGEDEPLELRSEFGTYADSFFAELKIYF